MFQIIPLAIALLASCFGESRKSEPKSEECPKEDVDCLVDAYYDNCEEIQEWLIKREGEWYDDQVIEEPWRDAQELREMVQAKECVLTTYWTSVVDRTTPCHATTTLVREGDEVRPIAVDRSKETECGPLPYRRESPPSI